MFEALVKYLQGIFQIFPILHIVSSILLDLEQFVFIFLMCKAILLLQYWILSLALLLYN